MFFLPYHHAKPCMACRVVPCMSFHISSRVMLFRVVLYHVIYVDRATQLVSSMQCHVMSCQVMQCHIVSCHHVRTLSDRFTPCHVASHHVVSYHVEYLTKVDINLAGKCFIMMLTTSIETHPWSSGRIHRCHRCDPGAIPGGCMKCTISCPLYDCRVTNECMNAWE